MTLSDINAFNRNTLMEHLRIEYTHYDGDSITARMPVDHTTHQPMGLLHGGATMALAESVGSVLSAIAVMKDGYSPRGMQITGNHVRAVRSGYVFARASFLHKGRTSHVVDITVTDEAGNLVSSCRITNAIVKIQE